MSSCAAETNKSLLLSHTLRKQPDYFKQTRAAVQRPDGRGCVRSLHAAAGRLHSLQAQTCHSAASPTHPRLQVKTHTVDSWNIQHTFEIAILSHVRGSVCRAQVWQTCFSSSHSSRLPFRLRSALLKPSPCCFPSPIRNQTETCQSSFKKGPP